MSEICLRNIFPGLTGTERYGEREWKRVMKRTGNGTGIETNFRKSKCLICSSICKWSSLTCSKRYEIMQAKLPLNHCEARKLLSAFKVCIDILSRLLQMFERERDFFTIARYGNGNRNEKVNGTGNANGNL